MSHAFSRMSRRRRFNRLVAAMRTDLYRYACWLTRDASLADDLVQETMLRAWRAIDTLQDDHSAGNWLVTILRREWSRTFERRTLEVCDIDSLTEAEHTFMASSSDPRLDELRDAVLRLEREYREPLVLQVLMGHTTGEIASIMGLTQGAVLTRLHRARRKLMEGMDDSERMHEQSR